MLKNVFLKLLLIFSLFLFSFNVFASDRGFKVEEQKGDSIKFVWDKDSKASYYQIIYGEKPLKDRKQSIETEAFDGNSFEIKNIDVSKKYYFNLIALDLAGNEVFRSSDLVFEPKTSTESNIFSLKSITLKEKNVLRLTFSKNIDFSRSSDFSFKVIPLDIEKSSMIKDFSLIVKELKKVDGDLKSLDLYLGEDTVDGKEYKLVVLAIFDEKGQNTKFGVDSELKFKGGEIDKVNSVEIENNLNSAGPVEPEFKEKVSTGSVLKVDNSTSKKVLTGSEGKIEEVGKNVDSISGKKDNLPKTGPEMLILFLIAFLLGFGLIFYKSKKS